MTGSYLLYNELHYNCLMTDWGLSPSLYHLEEHCLQEHTLLHLCVIVSNLAEMFFCCDTCKTTLFTSLSSFFSPPSFLARVRALQEFCFFAVTSVTVDGVESTSSSQKTTYRFAENNVSFCRKQRIVLLKTTYRFVENNVSFY